MSDGVLTCNKCEVQMIEGEAAMKSTFASFLFFGFSRQHLYFRDKGDETRTRDLILKDSTVAIAFKCPSCKSVTITREPSERRWIYF